MEAQAPSSFLPKDAGVKVAVFAELHRKERALQEANRALLGEIAEDIIGYLRTVPMSDLEGPSGFLHLREDLNDRARIRSGGKIRELIIQALVLE